MHGRLAPRGQLPDFLVIGAMKAGTTRLHAHLAAHAEVGVPRIKETDFFVPELSRGRGFGWYLAQFPPARLRGEVSPNYAKSLVFPGVAQRISRALPRAKLIYLTRDPVARALSEYRHKVAAGRLRPGQPLGDEDLARLIDPGLYHRQALAYLAHYPEPALLALTSEDLAARPEHVLGAVATHLGVKDDWPAPQGHDNSATQALPGWYWRLRESRPAQTLRRHLPPDLAARLRRAVMRPARPITPPDGLADQIRELSWRDADRFRALTGLKTPGWSV